MSQRRIDMASLTVDERLDLLEQVWESLSATPDDVPITDAQREELDRRLDDLEREEPVGLTWADVLNRSRR
jgi:putative addiction module component (TIGR02574 family)